MSSGKVEKSEKSAKLPRERSKGSKEKDSCAEQVSDGPKSDPENGRSVSPKNKKKRTEIVSSGVVRFEGAEQQRLGAREKLNSRSSSAGPVTNTEDSEAKPEMVDEADALMAMFRDFTARMTGSLAGVVRKNHDLKSQVSLLLRAAHSEEPPFEAMMREKDALSRVYDQLRYEHQVLQKEFQQIRRENLELMAMNQELQTELAAIGTAGSASTHNTSISTSLVIPIYAHANASSPSAAPPVVPVTSPPANQPRNERLSSPPLLDVSAVVTGSHSPSPLQLKRKDNVAELERSILDLEEEIRSPRAGSSPSSTTESSAPASPGSRSDKGDIPTIKKRKVPKSHSNELPNAQSVVASSSASTSANNSSVNGSSSRAKGPPERAISAPSEVKKSAINSSTGSNSSSTGTGPSQGLVSSPSNSSNGSSGAGNSSRINGFPPDSVITTTTAASYAPNKIATEEREQQRLSKYTAGPRRASPHTKSHNSAPPSPNHLTQVEQTTFMHIFRKWDNNDDDLIDRHELELTLDSMSQNENLKDLYTIVYPHFSKIAWDTLSIGKYTQLSLGAALTFLSDCKVGVPNPQVFGK